MSPADLLTLVQIGQIVANTMRSYAEGSLTEEQLASTLETIQARAVTARQQWEASRQKS